MQRARIQEMDTITGEVEQDAGPKWKVIGAMPPVDSFVLLPRGVYAKTRLCGRYTSAINVHLFLG